MRSIPLAFAALVLALVVVAGANKSSSAPSASAIGLGANAMAPQITPDTAITTHAARLIRRARRINFFKPSTLRPERPGTGGNVTGGLGDPPCGNRIG